MSEENKREDLVGAGELGQTDPEGQKEIEEKTANESVTNEKSVKEETESAAELSVHEGNDKTKGYEIERSGKESKDEEEAAQEVNPPEAEAEQQTAATVAAEAAQAEPGAKEEARAAEAGDQEPASADEERAKRIAEAKAKAAAAAKARGEGGAARARPDRPRRSREEKAEPKELPPSPLQPLLDQYVKILKKELGDDCLEESYINRLSKDVPTLVAKKETYFRIAETLQKHPDLGFTFLSELHGTDFQTHMEVYLHLFSFAHKHSVALKVKLDRENPEIESVTPLWAGANWPECEAYDLLGIRFTGHPKLHRIFLGEDWVGHPLRKDYEPYDVEV